MQSSSIRFILVLLVAATLFSSCISLATLIESPGEKMNLLELGMSKKKVTTLLNSYYTIAEKRQMNDITIEVLSYRFNFTDEIYMFVFENDSLIEWYRELVPQYHQRRPVTGTSSKDS